MSFESLETKVLLAADVAIVSPLPFDDIDLLDPPTAVVIVEGTDEADRISAFVDSDNMLRVNVNGDVSVYNSDDIDGIYVNAKGGNDLVRIDASVFQWTKILGGEGKDGIQGGSGNDHIIGGEGNDRIRGGAGNDLIEGRAGDDTISGGRGNDAILGGRGNDNLSGGRGNDAIAGGSGNDRVSGGAGDDWLFGDATNDVPDDYAGLVDYARRYGNTNRGNDKISAGSGDDIVLAGNGNDTVNGGAGSDIILAGAGDDSVRGGNGRFSAVAATISSTAVPVTISLLAIR